MCDLILSRRYLRTLSSTSHTNVHVYSRPVISTLLSSKSGVPLPAYTLKGDVLYLFREKKSVWFHAGLAFLQARGTGWGKVPCCVLLIALTSSDQAERLKQSQPNRLSDARVAPTHKPTPPSAPLPLPRRARILTACQQWVALVLTSIHPSHTSPYYFSPPQPAAP